MDRNELNKWRRNVPRALAGFAITPFVINLGVFASNEKLFLSVIIPAFGYFFWFAYDAVGFREALWREEMDRFVNKQIKERIESLFPPELNITREEMDAIREKEIKKRLSGIFWETVDSDSQLKETKAWFFEKRDLLQHGFRCIYYIWTVWIWRIYSDCISRLRAFI